MFQNITLVAKFGINYRRGAKVEVRRPVKRRL